MCHPSWDYGVAKCCTIWLPEQFRSLLKPVSSYIVQVVHVTAKQFRQTQIRSSKGPSIDLVRTLNLTWCAQLKRTVPVASLCKNCFCILQAIKNWTEGRPGNDRGYSASWFSSNCTPTYVMCWENSVWCCAGRSLDPNNFPKDRMDKFVNKLHDNGMHYGT